jgi:hypothetical protein
MSNNPNSLTSFEPDNLERLFSGADDEEYRNETPLSHDNNVAGREINHEKDPFEELSSDGYGVYGETVDSIVEDVDIEELEKEVLSWKIDHSTGDHKLKGMETIIFDLK